MAHVIALGAAWFVGLVAVVALVSGPADAVSTAKTGMTTIGVTIGAVTGNIGNMIGGYKSTKDAADQPPAG